MDANRTPVGRYERLPRPYDTQEAFIPNPLPPELAYASELVGLLSRADQALGRVASIVEFVPDPALFIQPLLTLEAVASTRIEGTQTTEQEAFRAQALRRGLEGTAEQEVVNYIDALKAGADALGRVGGRLDLELVCSLQRQLLQGTRGAGGSLGRLRRETVWIGVAGQSIERASYVPPPPGRLSRLMQDWVTYVQGCVEDDARFAAPTLIQCAFLHGQFEMIHPFADGNGRTGRVLMALFLLGRRAISAPVLFLSPYFERNRRSYYETLRAVSWRSDWQGWVEFFLAAVEDQSRRVLEAAQASLESSRRWRQALTNADAPARMFALLDRLHENPFTTSRQVQDQLGVSAPTANEYIRRLEELGLLEEQTGRARGREYYAPELAQTAARILGLQQ